MPLIETFSSILMHTDGIECAEECSNLLNEMEASATGPCADWLSNCPLISFRTALKVRVFTIYVVVNILKLVASFRVGFNYALS